jgi:hypothetical protein
MDRSNEDLRTHLMAVIEAAPELPRDDREHLADVFLDELHRGYDLIPRSAQQRRRADFGPVRQAVGRTTHQWWLIALASLAFLLILPNILFAAVGSGPHAHHPPALLFVVLFIVAMRFFGPGRRGGRHRMTRPF